MTREILKGGYYYETEKEVFMMKPQGRPVTSQVEHMFREEVVPPTVDKKELDEVSSCPKCVADFEGDFELECYMAMFLMFRNHLGRVREAVGTTGTRYRDECRRIKQILLVITPNTMVYFARGSKAFQYLGPKVGYTANPYDAEYPYHFYCEAKNQVDVIYARMELLEMELKSEETKCEMKKDDKRRNPFRFGGTSC